MGSPLPLPGECTPLGMAPGAWPWSWWWAWPGPVPPASLVLVAGCTCLICPVPCLKLALYPLRRAWHPLFDGVFVRFPLGEMIKTPPF